VIEIVVREFIADVAREDAWEHLAQVEHWMSRATHAAARVDVSVHAGPSSTESTTTPATG
jgi:hypothetical protein